MRSRNCSGSARAARSANSSSSRAADAELGAGSPDHLIEVGPELSRAISERHFGVGSDGLMLLDFATNEADLRMHMFNADGSRAETCGNALRCAARLLWERTPDRSDFAILTDAGIVRASVSAGDGCFREAEIAMGEPRFGAAEIPLDPRAGARQEAPEMPWRFAVRVDEFEYELHALSMGNPHGVVFVDRDLTALDLPRIGGAIAAAPQFSAGANIEFVRHAHTGLFEQRTFERGSGETLACGSGACAVVVAATCAGLAERGEAQRVRLRGGELSIAWSREGTVRMRGPAEDVCRGTYTWCAGR